MKLRLLDRAPDLTPETRVVVAEAIVPVRWWRGVPVRVRGTVALTSMERFLLELALAFGPTAQAEFTEVTDLPATLFPVLARRLVASGALAADGTLRDGRASRGMLDAEQLFTESPLTVDVVALPETGDVVVLPTGTGDREPLLGWERAKVAPIGRYPVDAELRGRSVGDLIIAASGDRLGVLHVDADGAAFPDGLCAAYRCTAQVVETAVHLSIGPGAPQVTLLDADGLIASWMDADQALARRPRAVWHALLDAGDTSADGGRGQDADLNLPVARRIGPALWQLPLTGEHATRLIGAGRNLASLPGLAIETAHVVVEVAFEFVAADPMASAIISVDGAINAAVAAGSVADVLHERLGAVAAALPAAAAARLAPAAVLDRAWQLGQYRLAYALREPEDFAYA